MSAVDDSKEVILDETDDYGCAYFYTSVFEDAVQHRNRLERMARDPRHPFDGVTGDGTFVHGKIYAPAEQFIELGVPDEFCSIKSNHVGVTWWFLGEMIEDGDVDDNEIVEQYPTYDGTMVERVPLA